MRRPGSILLLAIVIGALGAAMVPHLRSQQMEFEAARRTVHGATIDVMVARDTIPIGSQIEQGQIKAIPWPAEAQPEGIVHQGGEAVGRTARVTIEKNEPLLQSQLTEGAGLLPVLITRVCAGCRQSGQRDRGQRLHYAEQSCRCLGCRRNRVGRAAARRRETICTSGVGHGMQCQSSATTNRSPCRR